MVFYHYSFYALDYGFKGTPYYPNATRIIMSFAACSVPLFFMVNGALMFLKKRNWFEVYYKAAKIVVLIMIFSTTGFPKWFFYTLTILYLLFPMFYWLWDKHRNVYYGVIGIILLFPFMYNEGTILLKLVWHLDYPITGAKTMYSIAYFLLGNILFREKTFARWKSILLIIGGMCLLLFDCVILTNYYQTISDGVNGAFPTIGALFLSVGTFELLKSIDHRDSSVLSFFSKGILAIYLLHMVVIKCLYTFLGKPTELLIALIGSALICTVCCCIGWIVKKVPGLCFFMKI